MNSRLPLNYLLVKDDLVFVIFLPLPPKHWDHRCETPYLVYEVLGIKLRASCMLDSTLLSNFWGHTVISFKCTH